jgi:2,4-dienoyl-CoA reductase-like NADH-dependent reductase (Old Yellow Enzyme family)
MALESVLFSSCPIGPISVKNRFIRSATWDGLANADGTPQPSGLKQITNLALGEVGLILPAAVLCDPVLAGPSTFGLFNESHAAAWRPAIDSVHAAGSKLFFQIFRPGLRVKPGQTVSLPTARSANDHEFTDGEINDLIQLFVKSAQLAVKAGADGIQLHCAHGTLLSAFLSPASNKRTDKWGGSYENRARIVTEILTEVQKNSQGLATAIKFNGDDGIEDGIVPAIAPEVIRPMRGLVDLVEVSSGIHEILCGIRSKFIPEALIRGIPVAQQAALLKDVEPRIKRYEFREEYHREVVGKIRKRFPELTLAIVGGLRQFSRMEDIVTEGDADFVSLSRPLLRNPYLVREFAQGKATKSDCWNCGCCIINNQTGGFCHVT